MKYRNVFQSTDGSSFVLISTKVGRYVERGYTSSDEAAWQADRAKWVLSANGFIGRLTPYNFPERIESEGESAWSVLPLCLLDFVNKYRNEAATMTEEQAGRFEEASLLAQSALERDQKIEEEKQRLLTEKRVKNNDVARETLQAIIVSLKSCTEQFEALRLPKDTKPANSLHNALRAMGAELAALS